MAPANAMLSVQGGGEGSDALDAMVADLPVVTGLINKSYSDLKVLEEIATGDEFGIVVSKDNPELTKAINKALQELKADGTIDAAHGEVARLVNGTKGFANIEAGGFQMPRNTAPMFVRTEQGNHDLQRRAHLRSSCMICATPSLPACLRDDLVGGLALGGGCGSPLQSTDPRRRHRGTAATAATRWLTDGTLTCVSEMGFAPFEYIEAGSTDPVGYDIDVANELAKRMGLTCKFLPSQNFDTLVPTVKEGGKADIAIAGITINDERKKEVDFSDPYFESNLAVSKDNPALTEAINKQLAEMKSDGTLQKILGQVDGRHRRSRGVNVHLRTEF